MKTPEVKEETTMENEQTIAQTATQTEMDSKSAWALTAYLLVATVLSCCLVYSLWSAKSRAEPDQAPPPPKECTNTALSNLYPDKITIGSTVSDFLIIGCGFTSATTVKFNGAPHAALFADGNHIRVPLTSADVASAGTLVITLTKPEQNEEKEIGSGVLTIVPPTVDWRFFLWSGSMTVSYEVQLLLMVLFTGAFASSVYALKSLADYRGDKKLYSLWSTFYLIQPFEGAGAALLLYLLIRGGVLTGSGVDMQAENRFGMCAIAGLAGAFSDIAFLKLREVFINLLKPTDNRGGKLGLEIITTSLLDGNVGVPYGPHTLQSHRGTAPLTWSVTPDLPDGLKLDAGTGTISGTPTAVSAKTPYRFTVTDSSTPRVSASADLALEIKAASDKSDKEVAPVPDNDSDDIDGCDVPVANSTSDEDLPAAEGGVA
jgi:hypothetical protein